MTSAVAKRYARALASLAKEQNRLEETGAELARVVGSFADPELAQALSTPALGREARHALAAQVTSALGLSELTRNFLEMLTDRHRLNQLPAILQAYQSLVDRDLNRLRAILRVARPVPDATVEQIASALEAVHHKKILLSVEVDADLLAGATIEIEGRVYDGSARTQLSHIAEAMSREPTPD